MGQCYGKVNSAPPLNDGGTNTAATTYVVSGDQNSPSPLPPPTPARSSYPSPSPYPSPYPHGAAGVTPSPARGSATPGRRYFRRPFPPPSPAKHIKASLAKRFGGNKKRELAIPEDGGATEVIEEEQRLDKSFGYGKNFGGKYELGKEVGRGHFGHTCTARGKKGELKDQMVAVKIISKSKVLHFYLFCKFSIFHQIVLCNLI